MAIIAIFSISFLFTACNQKSDDDDDAFSLALNKTSLSLIIDDEETLNVTGTSETVTWSSSDENIATVDQDGKVTATGEGEATIIVALESDNTKTAYCKVTITGLTLTQEIFRQLCVEQGTTYDTITEFEIPRKYTIIADGDDTTGVFRGCSELVKVTMPDGLKKIGDTAFKGCRKLSIINIPNTLERIGQETFRACISLKNLEFPNGKFNSFGYRAFEGCSGLESVVIPNSVKGMGKHTFQSCSALKSVTIGSGVAEIKEYTFMYCENLESINIPSNIKGIGLHAFYDCKSLASVVFEGSKNWEVTKGETTTDITIASESDAATYLKTTYVEYSWRVK